MWLGFKKKLKYCALIHNLLVKSIFITITNGTGVHHD
jgi:hypothetical protein